MLRTTRFRTSGSRSEVTYTELGRCGKGTDLGGAIKGSGLDVVECELLWRHLLHHLQQGSVMSALVGNRET